MRSFMTSFYSILGLGLRYSYSVFLVWTRANSIFVSDLVFPCFCVFYVIRSVYLSLSVQSVAWKDPSPK